MGLIALATVLCPLGVTALLTSSLPAHPAAFKSVSAEDERIIHVLNRLGFGARPEDVANVRQMGIQRYVEEQLYPDHINDYAVDMKLKAFAELQLSDADIEARYKDFITADQASAKLRRSLQKKAQEREAAAAAPMTSGQQEPMQPTGSTPPAPSTGPAANPAMAPVTPSQLPANTKAKRDAIKEMIAADPVLAKEVEDTRQQLVSTSEPIGLLHEEFTAAKLIRAVESKRQLQEVLVDFWSNHFNIDIRKAPCGVLKILDDRNVIRPHIFGKFRELLEASAKSPAMLVYLDNFQSVSDTLPQNNRPRRQPANRGSLILLPNGQFQREAAPQQVAAPKRKIGLNENYAREIMELHTLGVNGGYTQQDVHEVARCFTGWSIGTPSGNRPRINRYGEAGEFQFYPRVHDDGEKVVLGHRIPAGGGMRDAEMVLDILAHAPATMNHVSYQLCQRLVCDEPPASLVRKCVDTWQRTDGDLREIVRTIVTSPEFYSPVAMRKKIKSPFEYAISSVRALDGTLDPNALISRRQIAREANGLVRPPQGGGFLDVNTDTLLGQIATMGQPLFQYQAPTGFPEDSRKWVSSGALISCLNFSLALTQGRIKDVKLEDPSEDASTVMDLDAAVDKLSDRILHGEASASTRATVLNEARASGNAGRTSLPPSMIAALLLGSPEFQRR